MLALGKVALSVLSGVYGECRFRFAPRGGSDSSGSPELYVQMTQISMSSLLAACVGYTVICIWQGERPQEFFSGTDGAWDGRTVVVSLVYCWREWICNLCVKRF